MKKLLLKYKWYVISFIAVAGVAIVLLFLRGDSRSNTAEKVAKWAVKKKLKVVKDAVEESKKKKAAKDEDLKKVEDKINLIEKEEEQVDKKVGQRTLKELDDAWETLGY